jgi:hypothetical protein
MASIAGIKAQTVIGRRIAQAVSDEMYPWVAGLRPFLEEGEERHPVSRAELASASRIANKSGLTNVDRRALWRAIKKAGDDASELIDKYRPGPRLNKCVANLQEIDEVAQQLEKLLSRNNDATEFITKIGAESVFAFIKLRALIAASLDSMGKCSRDRDPRGIINGRVITTTEWLAGVELPCVYKEFSGHNRPDGDQPKQMVDFVESAMKALDFQYSTSSIKKALHLLREKRRLRSQARGKNAK